MNPALGPFEKLLAEARSLSRRRLVGWAAALPLLSSCRPKKEPAPSDSGHEAAREKVSRPKVFGAREWRTIEAITSRILPSDDGPGAREAGVVAFIDGQLAVPPVAPLAPAIVALAKAIDVYAEKARGRPYAELDAALQDAIVGDLRRAALPISLPQRELYEAIHTLTLEGFLSDPNHGGNADQVGWKYIRFAEPTLREPGRAHDHHALPVVR
jgi:gluconate 2-dehydrogenase gamma chain